MNLLRSSRCGVLAVSGFLAFAGPLSACAQDLLDALDQGLIYASADGAVVASVSALSTVTVFTQDSPAQGLLITDDDTFVAPKLAVFFDAGFRERLRVHVQVAADRGFDPGAERDGDARFDEYFVEARVTDAGRLTLRVGKFASAFGSWSARNLAWDNPMITAPLVYEDVVPITDRVPPVSRTAFAARRNVVDKQGDWLPILWGPSYTSGASLAASTDTVEASVEVKNAAVSSRPSTWDALSHGFHTDPTVTGRLHWRPAEAWSFGTSVSGGPYMQDDANPRLPAGQHVDDFDQTTYGLDAGYEHRSLQIWSELVHARFDVPRVGDVAALSGYVEARYQITPQVWLGARWNQSWFDDVPGLDVSWNRDMRRLDLALGYRYTAHLEVKAQYSVSNQAGREIDGEHLFALQFVGRL